MLRAYPSYSTMINYDRDINRRICWYYRRHSCSWISTTMASVSKGALTRNAFRILAIRTSHLILKLPPARNDKRFDQTFGKHSSHGAELDSPALVGTETTPSLPQTTAEAGRAGDGGRWTISCFATVCAAKFAGLHISGRLLRQPLQRTFLQFQLSSGIMHLLNIH